MQKKRVWLKNVAEEFTNFSVIHFKSKRHGLLSFASRGRGSRAALQAGQGRAGRAATALAVF